MQPPLDGRPGATHSGPVRVALAGNPNAGKTSLFNAITGAHQNVGNYPGVTIEKRSGHTRHADRTLQVTDLPGTYSLGSYSPEERIAQDEILEGGHDVVVVVADATSLNRSLVLLAQVMLTGNRAVLCLNMSDEARHAGQQIDLEQMRSLLGLAVVETVGHRGAGLPALLDAVVATAAAPPAPSRLVLGPGLEEALRAISSELGDQPFPATVRGWVALRLLLGDEAFAARSSSPTAVGEAKRQRERLEAETGMDVALYATSCFFGFVDGLLREVVRQPSRLDARAQSNRIDTVLVNRVLGLPLFAAIMYGIFWLTFSVGDAPMGWIEGGFGALGQWVSGLWPEASESLLRSLLVDGVIAGVGGVLVFLPNIVLLFLGLAFLEDTGYMARAAFLMDRVMHRFGLHGKSFLPMLTGFGCSIPGIMATRTLENERDRITTMLVLPLISCGARLPIWMLLIPAFFAPVWHAPVLWLTYALGVLIALLVALLLRRSVLAGEESPFVMELPPYRVPTLRALSLKMWDRAWMYLRKAGTVILGISILLWAATAFPRLEHFEVDAQLAAGGLAELSEEEVEGRRSAEALAHSLAGRVGRAIEPVLAPLGFDWRIATGMIGAFAAKEVFVAQMGIVYAMGEVDEGSEGLREALRRDYSPLVGFSLILFLLIGTPCMATVAVTRRESGRWKWALLQFGGLTALAYVVSLVFYQVGRLVA